MTYQPRVSLIAPKVLSFFRCNKFWYLFATKSEIYIFVWKKNSDKKGKKKPTYPNFCDHVIPSTHIFFWPNSIVSKKKVIN